jgi:hypothetical protein
MCPVGKILQQHDFRKNQVFAILPISPTNVMVHMYVLIKEISQTDTRHFHTSIWSTKAESFTRFGESRCKRG